MSGVGGTRVSPLPTNYNLGALALNDTDSLLYRCSEFS